MIEVLVTICPLTDKQNDVADLVLLQRKRTMEKFRGCFEYVPSISLYDGTTVYVKEKWHTPRDLVRYRNSDIFLEYNEKIKKLVKEDTIIESFEHM